MAENVKITITGSPINLLNDINNEVEKIASNYQHHLELVEQVNEESYLYLETLEEINTNNVEINKNVNIRLKLLKEINDIEANINNLIETQKNLGNDLNNNINIQLDNFKDVKSNLINQKNDVEKVINSNKKNNKELDETIRKLNQISNKLQSINKTSKKSKLNLSSLSLTTSKNKATPKGGGTLKLKNGEVVIDEATIDVKKSVISVGTATINITSATLNAPNLSQLSGASASTPPPIPASTKGKTTSNKVKSGNDANEGEEKRKKKVEQENKVWASNVNLLGMALKGLMSGIKLWANMDSALSKVNKHLGLSNQNLGIYKQHVYDAAQVTNLYGVSVAKLTELQANYWAEMGRAVQFSVSDMKDLASFTTVFGNDFTKTLSDLDKYGLGSKESFKLIQDGAKLANKQGVDMVSSTKQFQSNIRLATQYTFRRGLKDLQEMNVNSMKLRMNMGEVAKLADKTMSPEGAIEVAARLQVLGGGAAMSADPLSLLHESINDFKALGDRVGTMIDGAMRFDSKTGEINFASGYDRMRLSSIAEATGMDFNALVDQAQMQVRRDQIGKSISHYNSDLQDVILSTAQFEDGEWKIKGASGEMESVKNLSSDTLDYIRPQAMDIKDIAKSSQGVEDTLKNIYGWLQGSLGNVLNKTLGEGGYLSKGISWLRGNKGGAEESIGINSGLTMASDALEDKSPEFGVGGLLLAGTALWGGRRLTRGAVRRRATRKATSSVSKGVSSGANLKPFPTSKIKPKVPSKGIGKGKAGMIVGTAMAVTAAGTYAYTRNRNKKNNEIDSPDIQASNIEDDLTINYQDDILTEVKTIRTLMEKGYNQSITSSNVSFDGENKEPLENYNSLRENLHYVKSGSALVGRLGVNSASSLATKLGGGLARGGIAGTASMAVGFGREMFDDKIERGGNLDYGLTTAQGTLSGAAIGSMIAGPIGGAIGGALGGLSAIVEKSSKSKREKAVSKFEDMNLKTSSISQMDSLSVLREIGKSTYHIEQILLKKFGEVVSEKDMQKGVGEKISGFFNKWVTGVAVNDAVFKDGTITPIHSKDNLLVGTPNGPLFNDILPKATEFYGEKVKSPNKSNIGNNNLNSTINSNIEINGTIKLDAGKGNNTNINVKDLLNNPEFKKLLAQSLMNEISRNHNGGRTIGDFNKYTIF